VIKALLDPWPLPLGEPPVWPTHSSITQTLFHHHPLFHFPQHAQSHPRPTDWGLAFSCPSLWPLFSADKSCFTVSPDPRNSLIACQWQVQAITVHRVSWASSWQAPRLPLVWPLTFPMPSGRDMTPTFRLTRSTRIEAVQMQSAVDLYPPCLASRRHQWARTRPLDPNKSLPNPRHLVS
jgi:hypothetical protein